MIKKVMLLIVIMSSFSPVFASDKLDIIPLPQSIEVNQGSFRINEKTVIYCDEDDETFSKAADYLALELKKKTGINIPIKPDTGGDYTNSIYFGSERHAKEKYVLFVNSKHIEVAAYTPQGAFYAAVTILQLIEDKTIPCVVIADWPRFKWRGLMLDCSRTFQSIDYIKKTIDRMALYKMNVLHLHLTDDQGWRIEIKKYPELTAKGARFPSKYNEPASHEGYYTQQQMKELIRYAADRNIEIIPEIEMPGHTLEVLACYPELSCTGGPFEIFPFFKGPGINNDILCAGNEKTFEFLQNVLDEVFEIFPSDILHVGGDEAPKARWHDCPKCQKRIKNEGLKDEHGLQSYFITRMEKYANSKGKRIIGWDEILEGGLAPNAAVMSWRGIWGGIASAKAGHDVVMSPTSHCYFDYTYKAIDTRKAYSFEPVPEVLTPDQAKHILGLQANFWSHIDRQPELVDRQLWPRLLAIAERGWSAKNVRDFEDFSRRVQANIPRLDSLGISYKHETFDTLVGNWKTGDVTEEYSPVTIDVTKHITKAGPCKIRFQYTRGACRLGIEKVELLADGKVISVDKHRGVTGASDQDNEYNFDIDKYNKSARYQLRAFVRSEGGLGSYGDVFIVKDKK